MIRTLLRPFLALLLALAVSACGVDDGTRPAKLEKAQILMDGADYAGAETVLLTLCTDPADLATCDNEVLALLAEARMGKGGVDLLNLLAALDQLTVTDSTSMFDLLDAMFGSGVLDAGNIDNLQAAIDALSAIPAANRDANDSLELAVAAAAHLAASVMLATDPGNTGTYDPTGVDATLADTVTTDLALVIDNAAVVDAALGGTTDITGDLQGLKQDIQGAGADNTVTATELSAFVGTL